MKTTKKMRLSFPSSLMQSMIETRFKLQRMSSLLVMLKRRRRKRMLKLRMLRKRKLQLVSMPVSVNLSKQGSLINILLSHQSLQLKTVSLKTRRLQKANQRVNKKLKILIMFLIMQSLTNLQLSLMELKINLMRKRSLKNNHLIKRLILLQSISLVKTLSEIFKQTLMKKRRLLFLRASRVLNQKILRMVIIIMTVRKRKMFLMRILRKN